MQSEITWPTPPTSGLALVLGTNLTHQSVDIGPETWWVMAPSTSRGISALDHWDPVASCVGFWTHPPVGWHQHQNPRALQSETQRPGPTHQWAGISSGITRPCSQRTQGLSLPISGPSLGRGHSLTHQWADISPRTTTATNQPCQDQVHPPAGRHQPGSPWAPALPNIRLTPAPGHLGPFSQLSCDLVPSITGLSSAIGHPGLCSQLCQDLGPAHLFINEFGKVAGYKINIQKSVAFIYTNNELSEREIKETISFTIVSKRIKYLGINLSKEVKYLYLEDCETLMKEIEDNTNRWKIYHVHGLEELILLKWLHYPRQFIDSLQFLSKYKWHFPQN